MIIYSKGELLFNENKETQFTLLDFWRLRELKTYCFTWSNPTQALQPSFHRILFKRTFMLL